MKWLALILVPFCCIGQGTKDPEEMLDRIADQLLNTADGNVSYEELYETLTHLLANPLDLNTVSREQLRAAMLLTEQEINSLLEHRKRHGRILDVVELQAVPDWSVESVRRVIPFVMVRDPNAAVDKSLLLRILKEENQYAVLRYERTLERSSAYRADADSSHRFAGNPDRYYFRYRILRQNDFSIGITAEKDPGEAFQWSPASTMYGFDYYSGHIQLMKKGRLENFIIGDFQCQFGQGLQLGSVFGLGKTAQTITGIRRSNLGFLPYVSAGESAHLRGAALALRVSNTIRLNLFGSQKQSDGMVDAEEPVVTAIQSSGLHRTSLERMTKGTIADRDLGAVLQFHKGSFEAGLIAHQKQRSHAIKSKDTPYNQFRLQGYGHSNVGAYTNINIWGMTCFAEFAQTLGFGQALSAGAMGNITGKMEMAWLYRNFSRDYHASYSNAISESSAPQNEQGFYWGLRYTFNRRLAFQGYLDYFRFPWLRYRIYSPSNGNESLIRLDYSPSREMRFFFQAREELKCRNLPSRGTQYSIGQGTRKNVWAGSEFVVSPRLTLKSRIQGSYYGLENISASGMAFVQEASLQLGRLSLAIRYALFDTEGYENRQYLHEKDVWLATSLPAFEGSGVRNYLLVHYSVSRHLDVWFRWARTSYADREVIGSGSEEIAGNTRNDVKFQVRIRP